MSLYYELRVVTLFPLLLGAADPSDISEEEIDSPHRERSLRRRREPRIQANGDAAALENIPSEKGLLISGEGQRRANCCLLPLERDIYSSWDG